MTIPGNLRLPLAACLILTAGLTITHLATQAPPHAVELEHTP